MTKAKRWKPISKTRHGANSSIEHRCPRCMSYLYRKSTTVCPNCGQKIEWKRRISND